MAPASPATSLRGALLVLGQDDEAWLERVDGVLGRAISGNSLHQSMHGLYGWLLGGGVQLSVLEALSRTTTRVPSLRGLVRREVVSALHTLLLVTAFFEQVREVVGDVRAPDSGDWQQEDHSFVSYLYSDDVPALSAAQDLSAHREEISRWAAGRGEQVHRALRRNREALLEPGFAAGVVSRY